MQLPEYASETLARSPLILVAAQINFEEIGREVTHAHAREFQGAIGPNWVKLQSAPIMETTVTQSGAVNAPHKQAYRLSTADGDASIALNPDSVILEFRKYTRWDAFREAFSDLVSALGAVFDPGTELRLGLRYIDQIPLPDGHTDWSQLIHESLLGVTNDPRFVGSVLAADQRVLLDLDDARCILRHGQIADPQTNALGKLYLLDFDVFRENRAFTADSAVDGIDLLHGYIGRLFVSCITETLRVWLRG